ncbi:unnamed protein product [Cochlearia groenlandica]
MTWGLRGFTRGLGIFFRSDVGFCNGLFVPFRLYDCFEVEVGEVSYGPLLDEDTFQTLTVFGVMSLHSVKFTVGVFVPDPLIARERTVSSPSGILDHREARACPPRPPYKLWSASWMLVGMLTMISSRKRDSCKRLCLRVVIVVGSVTPGNLDMISLNLVIYFLSGSLCPCTWFYRSASETPFSMKIEYCLMKAMVKSVKLSIDPGSSWVNQVRDGPERFSENNLYGPSSSSCSSSFTLPVAMRKAVRCAFGSTIPS